MKIQFDANQDYQQQAIHSIVDLFEGVNPVEIALFSQPSLKNKRNLIELSEEISANNLDVERYEDLIVQNMQKIQTENGLETEAKPDTANFSIEMETGTGKTYVYLRTIFELHQHYGLKKFIIVVPSIPIRAGVLKTLEQTREHFAMLYPGVNYNYYDYDSGKINKMKDFYRNDTIQIMIMTSQSFSGEDRIIHRKGREDVGEYALIDYISACRPVMILDEPQSSVSGTRTKEMIKLFNPLFSLYYSATHKEKHSLMYQLSPNEAYNQRLVKKIQVISLTTQANQNNIDIACTTVENDQAGKLYAKLLLQIRLIDGTFKTKEIKVKKGDLLEEKTKNPSYRGMRVGNMNRGISVVIEQGGKEIILSVGEQSNANAEQLIKAQLKETIKLHFEKKAEITDKNIKPLTLIFIDKVSNFLGETANTMGFIQSYFIECLKKYIPSREETTKPYAYYFAHKKPKKDGEVEYKESLKDTKEDREIQKEMFNLIMKDKEKVLSFENPVEFIFSHSALKEGRDNPNVFTLCTLRNSVSETEKRQSVGRGLRIPVNQEGKRVYDDNLNRLSVIVNQSYENFCEQYQQNLINEGYSYDKAKDTTKHIENGQPETIKPKETRINNQIFQSFWKAINRKTYYTLSLPDHRKLIEDCQNKINTELQVYDISSTSRIGVLVVDVEIDETSVVGTERGTHNIIGETTLFTVPSIAKLVQEELHIRKVSLARKTILEILKGMDKIELFVKNPRQTAMEVAKHISNVIIPYYSTNSTYHLSEENYDIQNILEPIKIFKSNASFPKSLELGNKALFEKIMIDSSIEETFGTKFKDDSKVEFFFKLNDEKFKISTPVGNFTPDWGVVLSKKENGEKKSEVYFMVENKGTDEEGNLKAVEKIKIACAKKHFKILKAELKGGALECDWFSKYDKFEEASENL